MHPNCHRESPCVKGGSWPTKRLTVCLSKLLLATYSLMILWSMELFYEIALRDFPSWMCVLNFKLYLPRSSASGGRTDITLVVTCCFVADGRFIAVASVDRAIYIYQVMDGGSKCIKLGKCLGHSSAVLCLDWSVDSQYLRSNSDNFELIYCKFQFISARDLGFIVNLRFTSSRYYHKLIRREK